MNDSARRSKSSPSDASAFMGAGLLPRRGSSRLDPSVAPRPACSGCWRPTARCAIPAAALLRRQLLEVAEHEHLAVDRVEGFERLLESELARPGQQRRCGRVSRPGAARQCGRTGSRDRTVNDPHLARASPCPGSQVPRCWAWRAIPASQFAEPEEERQDPASPGTSGKRPGGLQTGLLDDVGPGRSGPSACDRAAGRPSGAAGLGAAPAARPTPSDRPRPRSAVGLSRTVDSFSVPMEYYIALAARSGTGGDD